MADENKIEETVKLINKYSDDPEALRLIILIAALLDTEDSIDAILDKVEDALSKLDSKKQHLKSEKMT